MADASKSNSPSRPPPDAPLRVLVVEDEFLIAMDLEAQLLRLGHAVVGCVGEADEAVREAALRRPDVILMDLRLARGSSGAEAATRIRERFGIRCIFISGNLDVLTQAALAPLEPYALLSKPIFPAQLAKALEKVLPGPAGRRT